MTELLTPAQLVEIKKHGNTKIAATDYRALHLDELVRGYETYRTMTMIVSVLKGIFDVVPAVGKES